MKIKLLDTILLLALIGLLILIINKRHTMQWDFAVYYGAVKAVEKNLNPYDIKAIAEYQFVKDPLPYVYPPFIIGLLKMFSQGSYFSSWLIFFVFKERFKV